MHRADRAHQGRLPLPPDSERGVAQSTECGAARHAGACGRGRCAAAQPDCGRGCAAVDVNEAAGFAESAEFAVLVATLMQLRLARSESRSANTANSANAATSVTTDPA